MRKMWNSGKVVFPTLELKVEHFIEKPLFNTDLPCIFIFKAALAIESEIQTFLRDYYIQLSTAAAECGSNFLPTITVSNDNEW